MFQSNVVANYILCFLLGGKDRRGGPIIAFPAKTRAVELDRTSLTRLLVYLASIPRFAEFFKSIITKSAFLQPFFRVKIVRRMQKESNNS